MEARVMLCMALDSAGNDGVFSAGTVTREVLVLLKSSLAPSRERKVRTGMVKYQVVEVES